MAKVTIQVAKSRGLMTFEFTTTAGQPPRVESIVIMDEVHQTHCWMIEPGVVGGAVDTKAQLQRRLHDAGLNLPPNVDPIEDLSPLDPRYRIAERHLLDVIKASNPELPRLTYGVLPPGFQQILPHQGGPVPLESGRRYEISVHGRDEGSMAFEAL